MKTFAVLHPYLGTHRKVYRLANTLKSRMKGYFVHPVNADFRGGFLEFECDKDSKVLGWGLNTYGEFKVLIAEPTNLGGTDDV